MHQSHTAACDSGKLASVFERFARAASGFGARAIRNGRT